MCGTVMAALAVMFVRSALAGGGDVPVVEQQVLVEGQVTDPLGIGQDGAAVTVCRKNPDGSKGDVVASAGTSELGDFVVRASERLHGPVIIAISKPHYADLVREIVVGEEKNP